MILFCFTFFLNYCAGPEDGQRGRRQEPGQEAGSPAEGDGEPGQVRGGPRTVATLLAPGSGPVAAALSRALSAASAQPLAHP